MFTYDSYVGGFYAGRETTGGTEEHHSVGTYGWGGYCSEILKDEDPACYVESTEGHRTFVRVNEGSLGFITYSDGNGGAFDGSYNDNFEPSLIDEYPSVMDLITYPSPLDQFLPKELSETVLYNESLDSDALMLAALFRLVWAYLTLETYDDQEAFYALYLSSWSN